MIAIHIVGLYYRLYSPNSITSICCKLTTSFTTDRQQIEVVELNLCMMLRDGYVTDERLQQ